MKTEMEFKFSYVDDDGDEIETSVPGKYEVCGTCEGKGKHVNPAIDGHGISQEEFDEDPDFHENYMSGMYDIQCAECNGLRVVLVADESKFNDENKREFKIYQKNCEEIAELNRISAMERLYGA